MPASNPGSSNTNQVRKRKPRVKVKVTSTPHNADTGDPTRARAVVHVHVTVPDAKESSRTTSVARSQAKVPKAGDAPQTRKLDTKKAEDYVRGEYAKAGRGLKKLYTPHTTVPPKVRERATIHNQLVDPHADALTASVQAPVKGPILKVLDQTTRPIHAEAAAVNAALKGKNVLHAAGQGIQNKDRTTYSDVLKTAGLHNKLARGVAGTVLDIGLDPTTYLTGGAGPVAARGAEKAAASAARKSAKAGLTAEQGARMAERARTQALKYSDKTSGVTVKVAGKEVPGVRKATATASKPVRKAAKKATPAKVRTASRNAAADVNPNVAPAGVEKAANQAAIRASRRARAETGQGDRAGIDIAHGIRSQIGEKNYALVIDAIEHKAIKALPDNLHKPALAIRDAMRHMNRIRKQSGITGGEVKDRPHVIVLPVTVDTGVTAKKAAKARRAETAAKGAVDRAQSQADVHQGRAEVLSRNVSGSSAERAAERGRKRKSRLAPAYAGGGVGVTTTRTALEEAHMHFDRATAARVAADAEHEAAKTARAAQYAAHQRAVKINAKRAAAPKSYVPHPLTEAGHEEAGHTVPNANYATGSGGKSKVKPSSSKARTRNLPLSELHNQYPGEYRTDLHATVGERVAQGHASAAQAKLNQTLADLGTAVRKGSTIPRSATVYHLKGSNLREVTDAAEKQAIADTGHGLGKEGAGGRFVIVNKDLVDRARKGANPQMGLSDKGIVRGYDKTTAAFKRTALATLAFHVRNFVGDTSQAYVHQPGQKLIPNLVRAKKVTKELNRQQKAARQLERPAPRAAKPIVDQPARRLARRGGRMATRRNAPPIADDFQVRNAPKRSPGIHRTEEKGWGITTYWYHDKAGKALGSLMVRGGSRTVFVLPSARRQGVATKLYERAARDGVDITTRRGNQQTDLGAAFQHSLRHGTIQTGRYGRLKYATVAHHLVQAGAARSGYTARELRELSDSGGKKVGRLMRPVRKAGATKAGAAGKRTLLNREDIPRLATAIHALQNGATWEEAAQKVADVHIDYGHLTPFERNIARRLMPFYTWTARNIPIQGKAILRSPGKYAAYQKVREEAAKVTQPDQVDPQTRALYRRLELAGVKVPGGYEKFLSEYEQRNAGVPVSWKGHKFTVSMGLPLQDLNELPGVAGKAQAQEYFNKAMSLTNPVAKNPVEYFSNFSFFFRDQIERDDSPYVSAPGPVGALPQNLKDKLGVVKKLDKRSGKMVWQWRGKTDYLASQVPGIPNLVKQLSTPGTDRRGKGYGGKALAATGVKSIPIDPTTNAVNLAYARQAEIQKRLNGLRGQANPANGLPISAGNPTREYVTLNKQLKIIAAIVYQGKAQRGDKVLPPTGGPPKIRLSSGSGRVKLGGSSGAKVHLGGSGGVRVRLGG